MQCGKNFLEYFVRYVVFTSVCNFANDRLTIKHKRQDPKICDIDNLRACHAHLQNVEILHSQFDYVYDKASLQDFVYFDPPYIPVSSTASFTAYTKDGFGLLQQSFLRDIARDLKDRGVHVMLSNSECPLIYDLYEDGFNIDVIQVGRAINSKASKRAAVGEVLIT